MPQITEGIRRALEGTPPAKPEPPTQPLAVSATKGPTMASISGEIADAIVAALDSPTAQSALLAAVTAGEVQIQTVIDASITNLKGSGVLGLFITAAKGTVESEVNAQFAAYPPATLAALITSLAKQEATKLGG